VGGEESPRPLTRGLACTKGLCCLGICSWFPLGGSWSLRKGVQISDLKYWLTETEITIFARSTLPTHHTCEGHPRGSILSEIFKAVPKYSPVFDVFIQQQPFLAAIAWEAVSRRANADSVTWTSLQGPGEESTWSFGASPALPTTTRLPKLDDNFSCV
jgi:hypothetical protein